MDHVKFAIDMSSTVILVGYPELDMPVEWYCDGTEYKNYLDFMRKLQQKIAQINELIANETADGNQGTDQEVKEW